MNLDEHLAAASAALRQPTDGFTLEQAYRSLGRAYRERRNTTGEADSGLDWMVEAECAYQAGALAEQHHYLSVAATEFQMAAEFGFGDACLRLARVLARAGRQTEARYWCSIAEQEGWTETADLLAEHCRSGELQRWEPDHSVDHRDGDDVDDPQALEDEHVARRRLLAQAAAITMGAVISPPRRSSELRHLDAVRLSPVDVHRWRVTSAAMYRLACLYGSAACAAPLRTTLSAAAPLLEGLSDKIVRAQMLAVLAELRSLAGWSDACSGSVGTSLVHFGEAIHLARQAHDDRLLSLIICRAGCVYLDRDLPNDALKMFQLGQIAAAESGDDLFIAVLCTLEAWCYTMLRHERQAIKLLRRACYELRRCQKPVRPPIVAILDIEYIQRLITTLHELLSYKASVGHHLRLLPSSDDQCRTASTDATHATGRPGAENQCVSGVSLLQRVRQSTVRRGGPDAIDLSRLVERQVQRAG